MASFNDNFIDAWMKEGDEGRFKVDYALDQATLSRGVDDSLLDLAEKPRLRRGYIILPYALALCASGALTLTALSIFDPPKLDQEPQKLEQKLEPSINFVEVVNRPGKLVYKAQITDGITPEYILADFNEAHSRRCGITRTLLDARGRDLYVPKTRKYKVKPGDFVYIKFTDGPCVVEQSQARNGTNLAKN